MCFCGDCFLEEEVVDTPKESPGRMRRILSHVEPSSNTPRNLLHDVRRQLSGAVPGEIPWCKEVTAADVAGRMGPSTGYRSPPCSFNPVAASSSGPADGAKASAIAKIDAEAEALDQIALQLWKNPELGCAPAPCSTRFAVVLASDVCPFARRQRVVCARVHHGFLGGDGGDDGGAWLLRHPDRIPRRARHRQGRPVSSSHDPLQLPLARSRRPAARQSQL